MKYGSVCSGIEAATVAWHPLGWEPQWFSQYDPDWDYEKNGPDFASRVLAHHYPHVPNLGGSTNAQLLHKLLNIATLQRHVDRMGWQLYTKEEQVEELLPFLREFAETGNIE